MEGLKVGEVYSANEIGALIGGVALTSEDRIVTDDTAWERMTVDKLLLWLHESLDAGEITGETLVCFDSDPEGNGMHPMRRSVAFGKLVEASNAMHPEFEDSDEIPAPAVCFGAGY